MGISVKGAGIAIGGLTAIWLVNKVINRSCSVIYDINEASKWRYYYKYGDEYAVPPGYGRQVYDKGDYKVVTRSPEEQQKDRREENRKKTDVGALVDSLERIAKEVLKSKGINLDKKPENKYHCNYHKVDTKSPSDADIAGEQKEKSDEKGYQVPYLIAGYDFWWTRRYYDKRTYEWYEPNNVIVEDNGQMIFGFENELKEYGLTLKQLFETDIDPMYSDPDLLYLRDDNKGTDYEIIRRHVKYDENQAVKESIHQIFKEDDIRAEDPNLSASAEEAREAEVGKDEEDKS